MAKKSSFPLNGKWEFRKFSDPESAFLKTQGFPTEIHRDLLHHNLIVDPFPGKNEIDVQWVGEESWVYRTSFEVPAESAHERAVLDFAGLDTFASVSLDGIKILESSNMFLPVRVDISAIVESNDGPYTLEITFASALLKGRETVKRNPHHVWAYSNGEESRLAVRKAQYHYGWDWGPRLMTCGPWQPIHLELFSSRTADVHILTKLSEDLSTAELDLQAEIEGDYETILFDFTLNGESVARESVSSRSDNARVVFRTQNPELWYPHGYGPQNLYTLTMTIYDRHFKALDTLTKRIGIRKVKVKTEKIEDDEGSTFSFEVNNIPLFCGGSNWIPADSFLTKLDAGKYRDWIKMLAEGNQIMVRIWGGGIYEDDAFYDACDEAGILVWQDFMFACGNYPAFPDLLESVEQEAVANVKRLRSHPCIVIWAGNNEDYQIAESEGLDYDPEESDPKVWLESEFPARYIYEKLLKDVMAEHAPRTHYHFGSPWGGKTSGDLTVGDAHQWNVWHGTQEKYQDWDKLSGRFVSEFGMQALPDPKTVENFFRQDDDGDDREKFPESSTVSHHNKAFGHDRRLGIYLTENLRYRFEPFEYYVYCTQVMQAECTASAFRQWKRHWKGPGREYCAGALVWQANDCWPCTSWSVADYYLRPKLAYYAIKREMESITLGMKRIVKKQLSEGHRVHERHDIELWVCNLKPRKIEVNVAISSYNLDTGERQSHPDLTRRVTALPSRSTEIATFPLSVPPEEHSQTVVVATLTTKNNGQETPYFNWPEPLKYAHLPHPKFEVRIVQPLQAHGGAAESVDIQIRSSAIAKSVELEIEGEDNIGARLLSDNGFDMVPDVSKTIRVRVPERRKGASNPRIRVRYLECEGEGWVPAEWTSA